MKIVIAIVFLINAYNTYRLFDKTKYEDNLLDSIGLIVIGVFNLVCGVPLLFCSCG